jgi:hypothetical protein
MHPPSRETSWHIPRAIPLGILRVMFRAWYLFGGSASVTEIMRGRSRSVRRRSEPGPRGGGRTGAEMPPQNPRPQHSTDLGSRIACRTTEVRVHRSGSRQPWLMAVTHISFERTSLNSLLPVYKTKGSSIHFRYRPCIQYTYL